MLLSVCVYFGHFFRHPVQEKFWCWFPIIHRITGIMHARFISNYTPDSKWNTICGDILFFQLLSGQNSFCNFDVVSHFLDDTSDKRIYFRQKSMPWCFKYAVFMPYIRTGIGNEQNMRNKKDFIWFVTNMKSFMCNTLYPMYSWKRVFWFSSLVRTRIGN